MTTAPAVSVPVPLKNVFAVCFGIAGIVCIMAIGLCVFTGFLVFSVKTMTQPVVAASEQFLVLLAEGKTDEAYASTADSFRGQLDEASFRTAVRRLGLTEYASASWHNRRFHNQEGAVEGTVTTKNGGAKPVSIQLVHEDSEWKVIAVRYGGVDLGAAKAPLPVPTSTELERMTTDALLDLNEAALSGEFTALHGTLSDLWKHQITPQQLQAHFQELVDLQLDIGVIRNVKPQFSTPPEVNDLGLLVVAGHYPTQPSRLTFKLEYLPELGTWKLAGIAVRVNAAGTPN